ncbi:MAG: hypothetical protein HY059_10455 [Proteobacteria bacterium]|nr:hypothetical protein [Pseudomonadota bacterium]
MASGGRRLSSWLRTGLLACALWVGRASAEVIPVPAAEAGNAPTPTMYWERPGSAAVLILVPGGLGQLKLKPDQTSVGNQFYLTFKRLGEGADPKRALDIVLFDSPEPLENSKAYPTSRATASHMRRIGSVVEFYGRKTGKPVWLMGHSNGAISVTEYMRHASRIGRGGEIAGLIVSAARNLTYFDSAPLDLPVLFMSHRKDGCLNADPNASLRNFRRVQSLNRNRTSFVFIESGRPEGQQTCESGYHMYNDATQEVVATIRDFIAPSRD